MKTFFYFGVLGLILFEVANVYFIMPMPGSQRMVSIDVAYFLYSWRWAFRVLFGLLIVLGLPSAVQRSKWVVLPALLVLAGISYAFNFQLAADHMFYQPGQLQLKAADGNKVKLDREVLGVVVNGQAKAYPIQYIAYHHQVLDTIGGQAVMVTYCSVCRTGRVFRPLVNKQPDQFRLVGMDHFNAMFEDKKTGSWWRQANGEAIAGPLKGTQLPELASEQMTLTQWLSLYPGSLIMQPDQAYAEKYAKLDQYERGKGGSELTQTDSLSWHDKSWVVGVLAGNRAKAYDWNRLKRERLIQDTIGSRLVLLVLASDNRSFFAYERPALTRTLTLRHDTLRADGQAYRVNGTPIAASPPNKSLVRVSAYQEFWHSWRTFHPETERY